MKLSEPNTAALRSMYGDIPSCEFVAFYKGDLVPGWVLTQAIELAKHNYITDAGRELLLIPTARYEQAKLEAQERVDEENRRRPKNAKMKTTTASPQIKKWDCLPLSSFLGKPTGLKNYVSSPMFSGPPEELAVTHVGYLRGTDNCNKSCLNCGSDISRKRANAKYCSKACKQMSFRRGKA